MRIFAYSASITIALIIAYAIMPQGLGISYASGTTPAAIIQETDLHTMPSAQVDSGSLPSTPKSEDELRSILQESPEQRDALEQLALSLLQQNDLIEAQATYIRLLNLSLDTPALALRYAVGAWHAHQEYEAQAALIATARSADAPAENIASAKAYLLDLYNPDTFLTMARDAITNDSPDALQTDSINKIASLWNTAIERDTLPRASEGAAATSFFALWRGYSHIAQGQHDAARTALRTAIQSSVDPRTEFNAKAGIMLLDGIIAGKPYHDLLNVSQQVLFETSWVQAGESGEVYGRLAHLDNLIRGGEFADASAAITDLRYFPMNEDQRGRYLYLLGEMA